MIEREESVNPYQPGSSEPLVATPNSAPNSAPNSGPTSAPSTKALKYISHGVYLQMFLGAGFLAISAMGVDLGPLLNGPKACGMLLIGLGLNSLMYIGRYKKSLR